MTGIKTTNRAFVVGSDKVSEFLSQKDHTSSDLVKRLKDRRREIHIENKKESKEGFL